MIVRQLQVHTFAKETFWNYKLLKIGLELTWRVEFACLFSFECDLVGLFVIPEGISLHNGHELLMYANFHHEKTLFVISN